MKYQAPKGTYDILPGEIERWQTLEARTRGVMDLFGYREVRTPMFESTDLFVRAVGGATDIVRKELYTFEDKGGRSLTLRPEGTAPLVRAYVANPALQQTQPARLYYIGPMFRYERPQAGRFRQFWQIGAELLGSAKPIADAEMIDLFVAILRDMGLAKATVLLNSLGDSTCRPVYRERIRAYFEAHRDSLCEDDRERLERNPLRILDCKVPKCAPIIRGAPSVLDSLCEPCREHFDAVQSLLRGLQGIEFKIESRLVRGLDYYTRTVFEVHAEGLGAQNAVGGGGRYDDLVKDFGGPDTPAIGFSIGMERLIASSGLGSDLPRVDACVISMNPEAAPEAMRLARSLRDQLAGPPSRRRPLRVLVDVAGRSAGAQMKWASKTGARWAVFVPRDPEGYSVRNMDEGKDEPRQSDERTLREFLLERRPAAEAAT